MLRTRDLAVASSFTLPSNAVADRIKAEFREGILTIEVPKAEKAKPEVISIE